MNTFADTTELRHSASEPHTDLLLTCSRTLLGGIASSVLVLRASGQIAFANEAAERMIGRTTTDLTGLQLSSLFRQEALLVQPLQFGKGSHRGQLYVHGGAQLPVRIDIRQMQSDTGNLQGSVVTIEDLSDLLQMNECVQQMLHSDTLTGLPKGETLSDAVEAALMQFNTSGRPFALLELNVDQFRRIKESLGNDAASNALREVAARLVKAVEKGDIVTRDTSDAFSILLHNCASQQHAIERAEAVLAAFREPFQFGPYCTHVTASIGVSFSRPGTVTSNGFFTEAELALRRCKALGGNRVTCFEPSMADWHSHAVQMESQIQSALQAEEFFIVYQPQVCCQTGRLIGVESLLRWNSPTGGTIMPTTFIPAAEESGLIVPLGEWCMRAACKEMVSLQKSLGYPIRLAVNVSPKQIHSPRFKDFVRETLEETGLNPELLEIEITEGLLISHEEEALKAINSLQELGISVAMDDFGMGFSNLSYINRFKIDRLKIDRSFIMRCPGDHNSRMITTSLIFLAKSLGIEVVAEGVETKEQAALLADLRCDLAQGYLYSRPTTAAEICAMAAAVSQPRPEARSGSRTAEPAMSVLPSAAHPIPVQMIVTPPAPAQPATPETPVANATFASVAEAFSSRQAAAALVGTPASVQSIAASAPSADVAATATTSATTSVQVPVEPTQASAAPSGSLFIVKPQSSSDAPSEQESTSANGQSSEPKRSDVNFATHTILVQRDERGNAASSAERKKARRDAAPLSTHAEIEPREPICRPARPARLPGAMRIRWTSVPDSEAV